MKKNVLIKGILVLVIIAVFALQLVGCCILAGPVYIVVSGVSYYHLWVDSVQEFWWAPSGTYVLNDVCIGYHLFEAVHFTGASAGYDYVNQYIIAGVNYVNLYP